MGTAGSRCVTDDPALAHYLLHHAREELEHDQWALDDLAAMGLAGGVKFLAGHGEADAEHAIDLTEQIAENVRDGDAADANHVAEVIAGLYVRMFEKISRD